MAYLLKCKPLSLESAINLEEKSINYWHRWLRTHETSTYSRISNSLQYFQHPFCQHCELGLSVRSVEVSNSPTQLLFLPARDRRSSQHAVPRAKAPDLCTIKKISAAVIVAADIILRVPLPRELHLFTISQAFPLSELAHKISPKLSNVCL